jgi:superfamily II DNA or RNA helicase
LNRSYADIVGEIPLLEPRDYQLRIGEKVTQMFTGNYRNGAGELENAANSVQVESPTGSGKTPMMLTIAKTLQVCNPDLMVVWVAMRKNLLGQALRENSAPGPLAPEGKNIRLDVSFLSMFATSIPDQLLPAYRGDRRLLFIHDECTHDAAASSMHLHNELKPTIVLGCSAFPYRTDRLKLSFEKVVKDAGIHQLIQAGWLSEYDHFSIPTWAPEVVAHHYLMDKERWGPSLVFFYTHDDMYKFHDLVTKGGARCDAVTADTDRDDQLERLKSGELDCLVNCNILTEGMNFPDLKTCFVRDTWKGCTIQQAGRIFRRSGLHSRKQVVQSKETTWPMVRTAGPVQQWVWRDGGWLTLTANKNIDRVVEATREAMLDIDTNIPQLLFHKGKGSRKNKRI